MVSAQLLIFPPKIDQIKVGNFRFIELLAFKPWHILAALSHKFIAVLLSQKKRFD